MGSDDESKLAAPKLFGRKRRESTPRAGEPVRDASPTEVLPATTGPEPTAVLESHPEPEPVPVHGATSEPALEAASAPSTAKPPKPAKKPRAPKPARVTPVLSGTQAAGFAGLLVGAFLVLATYGSLNLCSTVRGTSTCGGRAGFPLLLAIGIVAVVGGAALMRSFRVGSPLGDSFLAVALVAVLTVLFLHNHYDAWWMIIAVPVLSILAFLLAHWISVTYIDPADD